MSPPFTLRSVDSESPNSVDSDTKVKDIVRKLSDVSTSSSSPLTWSHTFTSPNSPDFITTPKTIRQRGSEKKYEFFQEITHFPALDSVTCFVLNFIQVETGALFDTLERSPNIKHIELIRVIFIGPFNRKVELPKLGNFLLHQVTSVRRQCESRNLSQEDFQNLLFFVRWEVEDPIPAAVSRLELVIDGWTQFKLNYESGEFVSRLAFANDLLHRLTSRFKLRRLALQGCRFKFTGGDEAYDSLTYLNFQSILTSSQDLIKVLSHCPNLQELRFKNYIDGGGIHLKDIPAEKMKFLCLGLCTYTLPVRYSPGVHFGNLDTLVFPTNIMDEQTLEMIPSIFRTRKAIVYLCSAPGDRCKNGYYILHKLLQIDCIEWIWMSNFRRSLLGNDCRDEFQVQLRDEYEEFLISAGLPNLASTNLILEKKAAPARTGINTTTGGEQPPFKWIGREIIKEEQQVVEFQNRDGFKFSTWEAYMKRY